MPWYVTLTRGETPAVAKPVVAISDERIVRDVLRSLGKHLGITPTPLRSVIKSEKPDTEAER
jgi:hypothetical protein